MADDTIADITEFDVQTIYANDVFVDIGESEISLVFGSNFWTRSGKQAKPGVRIVLSHDNYIKMVDFMEKRAKLLRRAYMNRTLNLYAGDPEELRKAFDELHPPVMEDSSKSSRTQRAEPAFGSSTN